MGRKPDIPRNVGCKPVRSRRLAGRAPSKMVNFTIVCRVAKSHHRGWSTHLASRRYRLTQPNQKQVSRFVTPGGIGTHGLHPSRKRTPVTASQTSRQNPTLMFACAGGHSGPPLRGEFVSLGAHSNIYRRRFPTPGGIDTFIAHGDGYAFTLQTSC